MKKIVRGNDFTLKIPVMKSTSEGKVPYPLPACTGLQVRMCNGLMREALPISIDSEQDHVILAQVRGSLPLGRYAIEVSGESFGKSWHSEEYPQIELVRYNADADLEFNTTDEGDDSVEMDTAVVILPPSIELSGLIEEAKGLVSQSQEASKVADTAAKDAKTALAAAEHVNAELSDDKVLTVTNREGKSKSFALGDIDEVVSVELSSEVEGVSVSGIIIEVRYNHGDTPETYVASEQGVVEFRVRRGSYYEVSFPNKAGARSISPVGYTATLERRTIKATYRAYDERSENVIVWVQRHKQGEAENWQGMKVFVTIGAEIEREYLTDKDGKASFNAPWGEDCKVRTEKNDGYYVRFDDYERKFNASINERFIYFNFYEYRTGMFIVTDEGEKVTIDEYKARGLQAEQAVGVSLITEELVQGDGVATLDLQALYKRSFVSRQWCNLQTLFNSIPSNGNAVSDKLYYNGKEASEKVMAEAVERQLEVPAFTLANATKLSIADKVLNGYVPAIGQIRLLNTNLSSLYDIFRAVYGDSEEVETAIANFGKFWSGQWKWSSSQNGSGFALIFNSGPNNNGKTLSFYVLPFFAF